LTEDKKVYGHFIQANAMAHRANYSINALAEVFGEQVLSQGLWPTCLHDLNPRDFHLWGMLKDKLYGKNPHSLQEVKENIR
jgi:hypothetical protein